MHVNILMIIYILHIIYHTFFIIYMRFDEYFILLLGGYDVIASIYSSSCRLEIMRIGTMRLVSTYISKNNSLSRLVSMMYPF